ncbi:MAG: hypothetical protein CK527_04160 [Nitrosarchaeum sp.]|nr:hypothetical protein [Nitrosarchaeum sp.]PHY09119.1 MAG: hypothetical protein CK527_04160 [Nitrosarchaeum sp.]
MNIFDNNQLECSSCHDKVIFDFIEEIECDWGIHQVIQCPNCEELFSIDQKCPAFSNFNDLFELNLNLLTNQQKINYFNQSHKF